MPAGVTPFTYQAAPMRVVFGRGTLAAVGEEMARLGRSRALVLSTPPQQASAEDLAGSLGDKAAGVFAEATMHTPTDVTARALEVLEGSGADVLIALGGGSTIGLGKALATRTGLDQIVIPTTYAGSEMTSILGETEGGRKTTRRDPSILPETVIYDVELTLTLPPAMSATSGLNAIAHAVEALYAQDRNPITSLMAAEAIRALGTALPRIVAAPSDIAAREQALYGAWLCGAALNAVGMALHHKLCHTLGGTFDLPHAETHAVVLPHATAFNAGAVPELLAPITDALGGATPGRALHALAKEVGAPIALRDLGMPEDGIDRAAEIATENPYWNPRAVDREAIRALIAAAWAGDTPS
ncbi:MAG: maleylacetate reductase [Pseudomonadota bacterium]